MEMETSSRVVVRTGKAWIVSPKPEEFDPEWKVCVYDNLPLEELDWDLDDYRWSCPKGKKLQLFGYTTRFGRKILYNRLYDRIGIGNKWSNYSVPIEFVTGFWRRYGQSRCQKKLKGSFGRSTTMLSL